MASRAVLVVFLLPPLTLGASDLNCTFANVGDVLTQTCFIGQVGTYRIPSDMPSAWNEPTWNCIIFIVGNQEGIARRIQMHDDNIPVGDCSGQITLTYRDLNFSREFEKRLIWHLCGGLETASFLLNSNFSTVRFPISVNSTMNLTMEDVFVNGKPVLGNEIELPVNRTWETLTSIGYPKDYPWLLYFTYVLKSESSRKIEIFVRDLDMDGYNSSLRCEDDYIDINDAHTRHRWCQGSHNLTSQGPILYITMRTDGQGSARGFELRYRERPLLPPASTTLAPTWSTDAGWSYATVNATEQPQVLTNRTGLIFSYLYVDYNWTIQTSGNRASRIKVTFTNVDLGEEVSCSQARVTLYKGSADDNNELEVFCGRVTPGVSFSWLSPLTVRLQTHGIAPARLRGFLLEYQSTAADEVDSCNSTVQVSSDATYLTFAGRGSGPADSVDCWWKLRAASRSQVSLQIEDLNLQGPGPYGCSDWLQVFNGLSSNAAPLSEKICGSTSVSVSSTRETMLVRFHSNNASSSFPLRMTVAEAPRSFCVQNGFKNVRVTDSAVIQVTRAPDDDGKVPYSPCTWRVSATNSGDVLQLNYSFYRLGTGPNCSSGSLEVRNCANIREPNLPLKTCLGEQGYVSTETRCMTVILAWSRSSDVQGFRAEVRTYKGRPFTTTKGLNAQAIYFISFSSGIVVGLIITGIILYCKRRMSGPVHLQTGSNVTQEMTQSCNVSLDAGRRESDQGRQIQSSSRALSEPPPPYPGSVLQTTQTDPPFPMPP